MEHMKVDILAFGAHPDDVEITTGGTLVKMKKLGYTTGVVDCTRGERGTYGTVEERSREAEAAAEILGLAMRMNLGFPDGALENSEENRMKVVEVIRACRPEIVIAPVTRTRHPDHGNVGNLVREASFLAGLEKIRTDRQKFRPSAVIHFPELYSGTPDFAVDVSDEWDTKMKAIKAHASQVYDEKAESDMVKTIIKSKDFWELIESKHRFYGGAAGVRYAEVFYVDSLPRVNDLMVSFAREMK